jgi:methyl-accepting chemotaxis protein
MRLGSSLAIRLVSALIAATFLATGSLLAAIFYFSVHVPMKEVRARVQAETIQLQSIYLKQGKAGLETALTARRQSPSREKAFDALLDRDGALLTGNLPSWPRTRREDWVNIEAELYHVGVGGEYDHDALCRDLSLPDGRRLLVGRDIDTIDDREEELTQAAKWGSISVFLFAVLGGLLISKITASRLDAVSNTARAVMQGDLSVRVPIKGTGDDFDQLGLGLNAMLDRNQELVASLGRVSDNIAHELRTPLAGKPKGSNESSMPCCGSRGWIPAGI